MRQKQDDGNAPAHCHGGHRERMRKRFQDSGLQAFQPHEVLELLLFYALPRVNTNPIAHDLMAEFHSACWMRTSRT